MNEIEDDKLDDFFRSKTLAEGDEPSFDNHAWSLMERKLNKRNRVILFRNSSVILLLLLLTGFGGYFLINNLPVFEKEMMRKNEKSELKKVMPLPVIDQPKIEISDQYAKSKITKKEIDQPGINPIIFEKKEKLTANKEFLNNGNHTARNKTAAHVSNNLNETKNENEIDLVYPLLNNSDERLSMVPHVDDKLIKREELIILREKELSFSDTPHHIIKPTLSYNVKSAIAKSNTPKLKAAGIKWGLSFIVGSENNTVNSLGSGKTTLNGGVLANAKLNNKWTLSSGLVYGAKNYNASVDQYTFAITPKYKINNIEAYCHVLEIPFRASYLLVDAKKGSFSVNTGLSSFMMIKEKYIYEYDLSTYQANKTILKNNANQNFLSVVELSATYQIKLKNKSQSNLGITPYIKLPLGGVGEGSVHLKSTGINLNYNYDFIKKKK